MSEFTSGFYSGAQDVLLAGQELGRADAIELIQEILRRIVELILVGSHEARLHIGIGPEALHAGEELRVERLGVLHALYDLEDARRVLLAFAALGLRKRDVEHVHGAYDGAQ